MSGTIKHPFLPQLRLELAQAEAELKNPRLFECARRTIQARIARLRNEIYDLSHAEPFLDSGPQHRCPIETSTPRVVKGELHFA